MSYSTDLRKRVVNSVVKEGNSRRQVSKTFQVHYNTVKKWVAIFNETGNLSKQPIPPKKPTKLDYSLLAAHVKEHPDWYQYKHAQIFGVTQAAIESCII